MAHERKPRRLGKRQGIARIVEVLVSLRGGVDLDEVLEEARSQAEFHQEFHQALAAAVADWPRLNEERAAGDVEGVDPDSPPLTWTEYLKYAAEVGEWDADRWGYPNEPTVSA